MHSARIAAFSLASDKTNWRIVTGAILTEAEEGAESITYHLEDDGKAGVTVIAAITAEGMKLPLTVIGKRKAQSCLAGSQLPPPARTDFSESGWTTTDVMCRHFTCLRTAPFCDQEPLIVMRDAHSAHRKQGVLEIARRWHIALVFFPRGGTDRLQPLDGRVFAVLKASARELWRKADHQTGSGKTPRPVIAPNLEGI